MKKLPFFASILPRALAGIIVAIAAGHAFADNAAVDSTDKSFLQNAYEDGLAEVKMGELGQNKSANADVKAFATQMVTDHSAANGELKTLSDNKKVSLSTDPSLIAQGKAKLLDARSGTSFDKAFADDMVSDHKKAVEAFEKAANEAKDPDVKAFAAKTLPTLRHHLSMAEELQAKVGK
jgi:putative membrane protein